MSITSWKDLIFRMSLYVDGNSITPLSSTNTDARLQHPRKASRWVNVNHDDIMAGYPAGNTQDKDTDSEAMSPPTAMADMPALRAK